MRQNRHSEDAATEPCAARVDGASGAIYSFFALFTETTLAQFVLQKLETVQLNSVVYFIFL